MHYTIHSEIIPHKHFLKVSVMVSDLPQEESLVFWLSKSMRILSFQGQTDQATYRIDESGESAPYTDNTTHPLIISNTGNCFSLVYEGEIPDVISNVNMISADLVELGLYACWYPYKALVPFSYDLHVTLPCAYTFISEGNSTRKLKDEKATYHIVSQGDMYDILLIASPLLQLSSLVMSGKKVLLYHPKEMEESIGEKLRLFEQAYSFAEQRFGIPAFQNDLVYVYSPRDGWGYMRNIIVVSAVNTMHADGHDEIHELMHSWWRLAINGQDHWIDEGLAEYSTLLFLKSVESEERFQERIAEYRAHITSAQTQEGIVFTPPSSPDRYVNLYEKTTILFFQASGRFGEEAFIQMLRTFYQAHKSFSCTTKEHFFKHIQENMGEQAFRFLHHYLTEDWKKIGAGDGILL